MDNKIDVNSIMKELEEKLRKGLKENKLDATGISRLIGEHLEKAKEKVLQDTSEMITEEVKPSENKKCKECGGSLKKQKEKATVSYFNALWQACFCS